jgi:hypothetical protein
MWRWCPQPIGRLTASPLIQVNGPAARRAAEIDAVHPSPQTSPHREALTGQTKRRDTIMALDSGVLRARPARSGVTTNGRIQLDPRYRTHRSPRWQQSYSANVEGVTQLSVAALPPSIGVWVDGVVLDRTSRSHRICSATAHRAWGVPSRSA